jgi:proline utilization trans-activator
MIQTNEFKIIVSDLYCLPQRTHEPFVQRVHRIILSLKKWDEELPAKLSLQQEHLPRHVTSLHLHYNKCVISTTRPILLYLFKNRFSLTADAAGATTSPRTFSPTTLALAESCVQAARASNSILSRCFVEGSLASFGYFDAHYLFSSTLILIMSAVMDPNVAMSDAISYAFTILKAMKEDGNIPSCDYYERLQRTRASVGKMRENHERSRSHSPALATGGETMWEAQIEAEGSGLGFSEGVPLGHPLIDSFLADKGFVRADGMDLEDQSLRDLACELGDEFLFGAQ